MTRFFFLLCFVVSLNAVAEKKVTVPLTYSTANQGDIVLRGQTQMINLPISILDGQKVEKLHLSLAVFNNNAVDKSLLWILTGKRTLVNIELKQRTQFQQLDVTIPPELISKRDSSLNLRIQHISNDPSNVVDATELTTVINAESSNYSLTYIESVNKEDQTLLSYNDMIRSGQGHGLPVQLVSLVEGNQDLSLGIAASLVQGWTLKSGSEDYEFDYLNVHSTSFSTSKPTVVYGTRDHLLKAGWINLDTHNAISGPYLKTGKNPKGIDWLLVVSGSSPMEVKRASKVFANNLRRLPESASTTIKVDDAMKDTSLKSAEQYLVSEFTDQVELTDSPLELSLVMPSNILFSDEDNAKLNLLLQHSRVAPGEGSMILRVNGKYSNSLPLRSSYWRDNQHYRINIPMKDFRPGINHVSVQVYGPVDIRNQQRRFKVYMSDKSNLQLSSWVNFIPTEGHSVSPIDFLAITDDCGEQAQITLDPSNPEQLKKLWRLLAHVSHRTHKAMPGLLVTSDAQQKRQLHIKLNETNEENFVYDETESDSRWGELKHRLFEFIAHSESRDEDFGQSLNSHELAYVRHTNDKGWYRLQLTKSTPEKFDDFLRSEASAPPKGILSEKEFSSHSSQFFKAAFIGYPAALSVIALIIIWWMSAFVSRYLESRK
ncbi:cellulose biosynthesis cyclic di-GMP-binding regulatory protein BcsB [Vibrio penaeicida]|uniref:cellulose biosynthesis cyclic di-GMP-binding regulatory protein BcsB n=1 Tax=Vibrio penaeicida TaxID=104609 RepID=UPI000CE9D267|nr:cellulose biosynthesis cyclic di-GMP-binding regulatory protein BcsB [Vibrio penaeicida]